MPDTFDCIPGYPKRTILKMHVLIFCRYILKIELDALHRVNVPLGNLIRRIEFIQDCNFIC